MPASGGFRDNVVFGGNITTRMLVSTTSSVLFTEEKEDMSAVQLHYLVQIVDSLGE